MGGKCSSCQAEIRWAVTEAGGKMPLDPKPEKRVILVEVVPEVGPPSSMEYARVVDTYLTHFATCPNSAAHRKPKAGKPAQLPLAPVNDAARMLLEESLTHAFERARGMAARAKAAYPAGGPMFDAAQRLAAVHEAAAALYAAELNGLGPAGGSNG